jgi:hypothetical protein
LHDGSRGLVKAQVVRRWGMCWTAGIRRERFVEIASYAEVREEDCPVGGDENVACLEISLGEIRIRLIQDSNRTRDAACGVVSPHSHAETLSRGGIPTPPEPASSRP